MPDSTPLDRLERWMQAVVMHPGGAASGISAAGARGLLPEAVRDLETVVTRSKQLTALDRLGIYAEMYSVRLVEVLTAEYPTTRGILGNEAFERGCRAFIARHPSTERTLQALSAGFPQFLKRHLQGRRNARLAVDVARIERAMEEVFDAQRAEPLAFEVLRKIPPDRWGVLRLKLTPALRLLKLECDADGYMTAVRSRRSRPATRARPSFVIVYRHNFRAWRLPVSREQFRLLEALGKGWPIGRAVYASCRTLRVRPERLASLVSGWFRGFAAEGLFVGVTDPEQS
ncbi:MAG TPA: DNA-binding domain-containing protein [Steroidobacteraceae bacterium]|nr:DNA-binding domain-containing protein [Steroidobacteraceae bacterium]